MDARKAWPISMMRSGVRTSGVMVIILLRLQFRPPSPPAFQVSISSASSAAKSCGDPAFGSKPSFAMLAFISGVARLALISALSLFTISAGVPAGARSPVQNPRVNRGSPDFGHRGHIGQVRAARFARDREGAKLSFSDQRKDSCSHAEIHVNVTAQQVADRLRAAFVGNPGDVDSGRGHEHFPKQVWSGLDAESPIQFPGIGLRVGDQFLHRSCRHRRCNDEHP